MQGNLAVPKKSTYSITDEAKKLNRQVQNIVRKFDELDNSAIVMKSNIPGIEKKLKEFGIRMRRLLIRFFAGKPVDLVVTEAEKEVKNAIDEFVQGGVQKNAILGRRIKDQMSEQIDSIMREMVGRQRAKIRQFKLLVENTARKVDATFRYAFKSGARVYDIRDINTTWKLMQKRHGKYDTVLFRPNSRTGARAKYPLRQYVNLRAVTLANEAHRLTTLVESSRNGILVGRVSVHGSRDSCIQHEGEFVFFSEAAKTQFIRDNPRNQAARGWKTIQELEDDSTHIFRPGCTHIVRPYPEAQFAGR